MVRRMNNTQNNARVEWVDYAKGICIVMVVMMHSTLGVEAAAGQTGWMNHLVAFAYPFRMPDFFLISGLFLAARIDDDWRLYIDKKVMHFAYFYGFWVTIQFAVKAPLLIGQHGVSGALFHYLTSFIQPFGTLWFIYLLPIFFVTAKLAREAKVSPVLVWVIAAELQILPIHTGWMVIDEFAGRFIYFYSGYLFASHIFTIAAWVRGHLAVAAAGLLIWGLLNGGLVYAGYSKLPFIGLGLGFLGAGAVVCAAIFASRVALLAPLRYFGEHSIVIYLAFFLPMAVSRIVLMKLDIFDDLGTISVLVTAAGVAGPLILYWIVRQTTLSFLFARPAAFRLWASSPVRAA